MTYQLEINSNNIPFVEEFFKSVAFVQTVTRVSDNKPVCIMPQGDFIAEKSAEEIIAGIRQSRHCGRTRMIEPFEE
jgi:hypothetical protein